MVEQNNKDKDLQLPTASAAAAASEKEEETKGVKNDTAAGDADGAADESKNEVTHDTTGEEETKGEGGRPGKRTVDQSKTNMPVFADMDDLL